MAGKGSKALSTVVGGRERKHREHPLEGQRKAGAFLQVVERKTLSCLMVEQSVQELRPLPATAPTPNSPRGHLGRKDQQQGQGISSCVKWAWGQGKNRHILRSRLGVERVGFHTYTQLDLTLALLPPKGPLRSPCSTHSPPFFHLPTTKDPLSQRWDSEEPKAWGLGWGKGVPQDSSHGTSSTQLWSHSH